MAFNLNKNEAITPSANFDLSKKDSATGVNTAHPGGKSKKPLFFLSILLLTGIAAWYFLSGSNDNSSKNENSAGASAVMNSNVADTQTSDQNKTTEVPVKTTTDVKTENENTSSSSVKSDDTDAKTGNGVATAVSAAGINNKVPATFAKGSNSISELNASLVKDLIVFLKENPGSVMNVNGYASSEGTLAVNHQISQSRADAFKRYLVSKGIPGNSINATGKGIGNPVGSNDTEEGRIKNRRVEIVLQ